MTRVETYLDSLANMEDGPDYPEVTRTRVENYLDAICKNAGRRKTMPTPGPKYKGKIVQYVGETTDTYTQGYFYKCTGEDSYSSTVTFANNKISCTGANFLAFIKGKFPTNFTEIVSGTMLYYTAADLWAFDGKNANGTVIAHYQQYTDDFEAEGFVFTGTFRDEETIGFTCSTTVTPGTYTWNQINVQPGGGSSYQMINETIETGYKSIFIGDYNDETETGGAIMYANDEESESGTTIYGMSDMITLQGKTMSMLTVDGNENYYVAAYNDLAAIGAGSNSKVSVSSNSVEINTPILYYYSGEEASATDEVATKGDIAGTIETYSVASSAWTALASSTPFTYSTVLTATTTIGASTIVELMNDNAVLFANHGFSIGSVSGQNVTIYSIGQPSTSVNLKVNYKG